VQKGISARNSPYFFFSFFFNKFNLAKIMNNGTSNTGSLDQQFGKEENNNKKA
jgi:hypothetical protein